MRDSRLENEIYSFIRVCAEVRSIEDFNNLVRSDLLKLLPHQMAAYGVVTTTDYQHQHFVNLSFPEGYVRRTRTAKVLQWLTGAAGSERRAPEFFSLDDLTTLAPSEWVRVARDFGVSNIACHGVRDLGGPTTTYFEFGRLVAPCPGEIKYRLNMVVPHLHAALSGVLSRDKVERLSEPYETELLEVTVSAAERSKRLSAREAEVLMWLYHGKTNNEIARVLNTSVFTVKNHVQNILMKLGATNRTQAVSHAIRSGLLQARER
ncbi:MAG: response regulator transcription factor [Sulfurifustaceae bacterium]